MRVPSSAPLPFHAARAHCLAVLADVAHAAGPVAIVQPLARLDPLVWLAGQPARERFYFHARDRDAGLAGVGSAIEWRGATAIFAALRARDRRAREAREGAASEPAALQPDATYATHPDAAQPAAALALRFDERGPDGAPAPVGRSCLHIPQVAVVTREGRQDLVVALASPRDREALAATLAQLVAPQGMPALAGPFRAIADATERHEYERRVGTALAAIGEGRLAKVVLARRQQYEAGTPIDAPALVAAWAGAVPHAYRIWFEPRNAPTFAALSPERLFLRCGRVLETEALAGTQAVAEDSPVADLLASRKDRDEHEFVRGWLAGRLAPWTVQLAASGAPLVRRTGPLLHLATTLRAELRAACGDADLLAALHPSPATLGLPVGAAWDFLRREERLDRGPYCGAIGMFDGSSAEVAVGIRAVRIEGTRLVAWVGAGCVAGSRPADEWRETEAKLRGLEAALGL